MADDKQQEPLAGMPEDTKPEAPTPEAPPEDTKPGPPVKVRPPRKRNRTGTSARGSRAKTVNIKRGMADLYGHLGIGVAMIPSERIGDVGITKTQAIGQEIVSQAEACGEAWEALAKENEAVRRTLERVLTVSSVGAIIAAHAPILLCAAVAYDAIPGGIAEAVGKVQQS